MKKCRYANKYKAKFPPRCNKGDPCDACKTKWVMEQWGAAIGSDRAHA